MLSWMTGAQTITADNDWAHVGIRLFEADGRIVNTLGGGEPKAPGESQLGTCSVDFASASVAAGADGAVFVLTQPNLEAVGPHKENLSTDDEIIEFAPGGKYACPTVTNEIEVNGKELQTKGGEPMPTVTVNAGVKTKFDAVSLDRPLTWSPSWVFVWTAEPVEWTPFAYEWGWNFGEEPKTGASEGYTETNKMGPENKYLWPKPETEHEYTKPGTYEARLRVYGDYGTSVFPIKVTVLGGGSPTASFIAPAHVSAGTLAVFNAATSTPAPGGPTIEDYHWEFGDGSKPVNTNQRTQSHTFAEAGEYKVTLTIRDNEGSKKVATIAQEVVVEPGLELQQSLKGEQEAQPESEEKPAPSTSAPQAETVAKTPPPTTAPTVVEKQPQTRVQKLAAALKSCGKLKTRKTRTSCEQQARKRYAPPSKKSSRKSSQKQGSKKK